MIAKVAILIILAIAVLANAEIDSFKKFERKFNKKYESEEERHLRKQIFERRLKAIHQHNKDETKSWKEGINHLSDMTDEEFKSMRGGRPSPAFHNPIESAVPLMENLPTSVDWRKQNIISPIKNQGYCGCCYAEGAVECIESAYAKKYGKVIELSVEQAIDCLSNPQECGGDGGCGGGMPQVVYDYVIKAGGITTEKAYPFTAGNGNNGTCNKDVTPAVKVTGYKTTAINSYNDVMNTLATVGPLTIIVAAETWDSYQSGIFNGCDPEHSQLDHVVQLVGYGTDPKDGDYWLIKNSWGETWGEKGYIRLARSATGSCSVDPEFPACGGEISNVKTCGTCGLLYQSSYAIVA